MAAIHDLTVTESGQAFLIREGLEMDAEAVYRFKQVAFQETDWMLQTWGDMNTDPEKEAYFLRRFQSSPNSLYLVALQEKEVIGTLSLVGGSLQRTEHVASLGLGVVQNWWGNGVGKRLMELSIHWAEQHSTLRKLNLQVYHTNDRAIGLYLRLGFQQEGRLRQEVMLDDQTEIDLIQMARFV